MCHKLKAGGESVHLDDGVTKLAGLPQLGQDTKDGVAAVAAVSSRLQVHVLDVKQRHLDLGRSELRGRKHNEFSVSLDGFMKGFPPMTGRVEGGLVEYRLKKD